MVLDGDFHVRVHQAAAHALQHRHGVVDVRVDAVCAIRDTPEHRANDWRAYDLRRLDHPAELVLGRSLRLVEHLRGRADGAHADLEVDFQFVGASPHAPEVIGLERAQESDFAEVHDLDVPLRREIQLLKRRPLLLVQAEHVDAEANRGRRLSGQRWKPLGAKRDRRGAHGLDERSSIGKSGARVRRHDHQPQKHTEEHSIPSTDS